MTMDEKTSRKMDLALLVILPMVFVVLACLSLLGYSEANFGDSYVFMTELFSVFAVLILPLSRVFRKFMAPYWFILMVSSVVYIHSCSLYFGLYQNLAWWDVISHGYSSFVVTMTVFIALCVIQRYTRFIDLGKRSMLFMVFIIGFGFGNVWEIWEWFVDNFFGDMYMSYSVFDTLGDIACDLLGAGMATLASAYFVYRSDTNKIVDQMNLDRFMVSMGRKWDRRCMGIKRGEPDDFDVKQED